MKIRRPLGTAVGMVMIVLVSAIGPSALATTSHAAGLPGVTAPQQVEAGGLPGFTSRTASAGLPG